MSDEQIKVVHAMAGRVRLKICRVKHNPAFAAQVQKKLSTIAGMQRVEANPVSGSVLLMYDPKQITSSLISLLESFTSLFPEIKLEQLKGWLTSPAFVSNSSESIATVFEAFNARVEKSTKGA